MPFNLNPQTNTVEYATGELETRVLSQDRTVNASTTLVAVPELTINMAKYQRIYFNFQLYYSSAAAADFKYRLVVPASLTVYRLFRETWAPDATALAFNVDSSNNGSTDIAVTHTSGTLGFVRGSGFIHNGANAGDFQLQFAQNTSDASNTILRAGSNFQFEYI